MKRMKQLLLLSVGTCDVLAVLPLELLAPDIYLSLAPGVGRRTRPSADPDW